MSKAPKPKWGFDSDNWPDQRENRYWKDLNRSQKGYAISMYNKARANKGLDPIPNPFRKDGSAIYENSPGDETITPRTTGKQKISPLNRKALNTFVGKVVGQSKHPGPLLELFEKQRERLGNYYDDPDLMDLLENYEFKTESTDQAGVSGNQAGSSKRKEPDTPTEETQEQRPPPNNQPEAQTEGTMVANAAGTAMETDDSRINRGANSSGALASGSGPITTVARPMNFANAGNMVFQKVHRVLTYGFAPTPVPLPFETGQTQSFLLMTTSLCEIPWDRPFFYLSPGEYDSLPKGCYVKNVSVEIVQRNPRVAFQTASSQTSLATLNQNKFGIKAVGLNAKQGIRVTNRIYSSIDSNEPMVPLLTEEAQYSKLDKAMYGVKNSTPMLLEEPGFNKRVPATCFLSPLAFPNYLTCWNYSQADTNTLVGAEPGWYSLAEHVNEFDMSASTGTMILKADYKPTYAPLTAQTAFAEYLMGKTATITASNGMDFNTFTYTDSDVSKTVTNVTINNVDAIAGANPNESTAVDNTFAKSRFDVEATTGRLKWMEKGQICKNIDSGMSNKCVQPSIHIGVSPVPRLTSTSNLIQSASWTDVQAYFEVKATMEVGYQFPHHNTHQSEFNVESYNVKLSAASNITAKEDYPIRFGKYNQQFT